jgi:HAD superfamily hydrolase (TIGR01509 family)
MTRVSVIFDMDGVLADTEPVYLGIIRDLFAWHGVVVPESRLETYVGVSSESMWTEIRREFGLRQTVAELVRIEHEDQQRRLSELPHLPPVAGVEDLILALKAAGARLGVASSSSRAVIGLILERTGLARHFDTVVSGEDVARSKPAPDIFLAAAARLNAAPAGCVVIEDSTHGVRGAKAAGMRVIGYVNPNSGRQDVSGADLVVTALSARLAEQVMCLAEKGPSFLR